jgi:hypothetical protein
MAVHSAYLAAVYAGSLRWKFSRVSRNAVVEAQYCLLVVASDDRRSRNSTIVRQLRGTCVVVVKWLPEKECFATVVTEHQAMIEDCWQPSTSHLMCRHPALAASYSSFVHTCTNTAVTPLHTEHETALSRQPTTVVSPHPSCRSIFVCTTSIS